MMSMTETQTLPINLPAEALDVGDIVTVLEMVADGIPEELEFDTVTDIEKDGPVIRVEFENIGWWVLDADDRVWVGQ